MLALWVCGVRVYGGCRAGGWFGVPGLSQGLQSLRVRRLALACTLDPKSLVGTVRSVHERKVQSCSMLEVQGPGLWGLVAGVM